MEGSRPSGPALEMRGVDVSSMSDPARISIRGVDWTLNQGEFWVIGGLQGSGKSDFLFMTGGLMAPAAGSYSFFGRPMPIFEDDRLEERLRLGLVFETGQLFKHLTIRENIALPLRYHHNLSRGEAEERVQRILDLVELGPWADSTPGAIGRNWQKRAGLARALMLQPQVLLVDNPLGGLDLQQAHWCLRFLDELSAGHPIMGGRPVTLVVTSADLRAWRGHARQLAILRNDRFTALGNWPAGTAAETELLRGLLPQEDATR